MSSILKALKKLEHDNAVRKPATFRIDADILRGQSPRRSFSTGIVLAAIAIFACGGGATYFYMKNYRMQAPVQSSQISKNDVKSEPSAVTVVLPVDMTPATDPQSHQPAKTSPVPEKSEISPRLIKQQQYKLVKPAEINPQTVSPELKPVPSPHPSVITASHPVLKLHGIAFQDGSDDGVAVVNGVAVSKGSEIEGVRVEEIQKDRVLFSRGSEKFEIVLDKSN